MSNDTISGNFGYVILPDKKTVDEAYRRAANAAPANADYVLTPRNLVHITLYHTELDEFPVDVAGALFKRLSRELTGQILSLDSVSAFRGVYIFWTVAKNHRALLLPSHLQCLQISCYRTNRTQPIVAQPDLSLTVAEVKNVLQFGHPWVKGLFCPHITLAYSYRSTKRNNVRSKNITYNPWLMTVEQVAFARIKQSAKIEILAV